MVTADTCGDINTLQRTEGKAIRMKGKCGITSGMVQKGLSGGSGSVSNTSSIAPPNHPSLGSPAVLDPAYRNSSFTFHPYCFFTSHSVLCKMFISPHDQLLGP